MTIHGPGSASFELPTHTLKMRTEKPEISEFREYYRLSGNYYLSNRHRGVLSQL